MMVLPTGFVVPPLPYAVAVVGAAVVVAALLVAVEPPVEQTTALALAPWMACGGALYAFYQLGAYPPVVAPLFSAPAVYLTTFVAAGLVWLALTVFATVGSGYGTLQRNLGLTGTGVLTVLFVLMVYQATGLGSFTPLWPAVAVLLAIVQTALTVFAISIWRTPVFVRIRWIGPVVIFAHALDGASTAIGTDVLGVPEQTPLPRLIMDLASRLPVADTIGVGWLFVLVKLVVAAAVVVGFNRYVDEQPTQATLVLSAITAVGLGPATNNLFLFMAGMP